MAETVGLPQGNKDSQKQELAYGLIRDPCLSFRKTADAPVRGESHRRSVVVGQNFAHDREQVADVAVQLLRAR